MEWHFPVDPDCPEVRRFREAVEADPYAQMAPLTEIFAQWEARHRIQCPRCRQYAVENVGIREE